MGHLGRIVGAVLLAAVLVAVVAAYRYIDIKVAGHPLPGSLMATRAAERLTGAACLEAKNGIRSCLARFAPIAAHASYRRCGGYVENVTAGPSQLACSESWILDGFLRSGEGSSFYREFRRACRTHDFCYTHAATTTDPKYGSENARQRCDDMLLADVVRDCRLLYPVESEAPQRARCMRQASFVHFGVQIGGSKHFDAYRPPLCDFDHGPHAPRDHVVSGRFLPGQSERVATLVEEPNFGGISIEVQALDETGGVSLAADPVVLSPWTTSVADKDTACSLKDFQSGSACTAPSVLGEAGFLPSDWLRFAPVIIDSDGDGIDEILLVSLTPKAGLILTHVRFDAVTDEETGEARIVPNVLAYAGADAKSGKSGQRAKEFGPRGETAAQILTSERAAQMLAHQLVVVQRAPDDCGPLAETGPEDALLVGSRGEPGSVRDPDDWEDAPIEAIKRRMYRFTFDAAEQRWRILRDSYAEDGHRMSQCAGREPSTGQRNRQHQLFRLQYPAFATRGPVRCNGTTVIRESISVVTRESCPSSTRRAEAGDLNDIDLISYTPRTSYTGDDHEADPDSVLSSARVSWLPLSWSEAADPVLTSRAARRAGVVMASVYAGGTRQVEGGDADKSRFLLVNVLANDERLAQSAKVAWRQRLPDTVGLPPRQFAILKSDVTNSNAPYWPRSTFGDPGIFLQIPSILAPFWTDGSDGISLVMFANRATFEQEHKRTLATENTVKPGTLQVMIVPLVRGKSALADPAPEGPLGEPRWIECKVPAIANTAMLSARQSNERNDDLLYQEPVLPGRFFEGDRGGFAIAYRTEAGRIAFTSLRPFGRFWKLGDEVCRTMSRKFDNEKGTERDVWMMRLN